jgi:hypothetical protein
MMMHFTWMFFDDDNNVRDRFKIDVEKKKEL